MSKPLRQETMCLLFSEDVSGAIKKLKRAIRREEIKQSEVDERVRKILTAKYWAGLNNFTPIDTTNLIGKINDPISDLIRQKLYENALPWFGTSATPFPYASWKIATLLR